MEVVSPDLYVGTLADAEDARALQENSIDKIISLTHTDPEVMSSVSVSKYAMLDGPRNDREVFQEAVEEAIKSLGQGDTVLVHCSRGASRSPSVAVTATALHEKMDIEEAFEQIRQQREKFDVHPALVQQAINVYRAYQT